MQKNTMDLEFRIAGIPRAALLAISSRYSESKWRKSAGQLAITSGLWASSYAAGLALMSVVPWAGVLAGIAAAIFVVRLFMIQHDCGHRSFFRSHAANDTIGSILGVLTLTPYRCWRRFHAQHHVHSGNLDQRGMGDVRTLTTEEYRALAPRARLIYRLYRHPLVLIVVGPPLLFILRQRTTYKVPTAWRAERASIHATNVGIIVLLSALCMAFGVATVLPLHLLMMWVASSIGVWLFYVQHQFSDTYWEHEAGWESCRASMQGASHLELPRVLRWLTANIGLHHIHHLDARIPNYRLYECFQAHPEFSRAPRIGLAEGLRCLRLGLWDSDARRLVGFDAVVKDGR